MVLTYPINHGGNSSFIKSSSSLSNKSSNPILPPFLITAVDCHLCITINVKHVLPENFVMKFHPDSDASKIQCDFCNGATDYCLCLSFHSQSLFIINSPVVDVWDNNVTVQFELDFRTSCDSFEFELFSGWDWSILEQVKVDDVVREVKDSLKKKLKNEAPISMLPKPEDILTDVPNLKPETSQPLEGDQVEDDCRPTARSNDKTGRVGRSYSESSDDGSLSSTPNRGILKRRFKSRSYSESSFDELPFRESLPEITNEPSFGSYKEENVGSVDRSKKTVRFSNVVKEQIYRVCLKSLSCAKGFITFKQLTKGDDHRSIAIMKLDPGQLRLKAVPAGAFQSFHSNVMSTIFAYEPKAKVTCEHFIAAAKHLTVKIPSTWKEDVLFHTKFLVPSLRKNPLTAEGVLAVACQLPISIDVDRLHDEWRLIQLEDEPEDLHDQRVDSDWTHLLIYNRDRSFSNLKSVLRASLIVLHGSANIECNFCESKNALNQHQALMLGITLNAKLTVKDALKPNCGKVKLTNSSIVGQRKKNQRKAQCKKRKMSLSSSIESSDGEFMSQASKVKDLETEEKVHSDYAPHPPDCVDPGTKEQFEVIEQNEVELGESLDGTHINDSGVELDGEAQIEGKRESNKSKRKKGKGKKKNEITDLMFALEI
ncbi:hypothetical protein QYM36_013973 [Artemia franciscana]|uniref:Uncharacterized protein n=1 Tax=Artemia franciscana TaxID=6661 RepID=A0AA88L0H3_ARTSF|nr:hypothetical protein QYM36_013973 [Artemia franciscana]